MNHANFSLLATCMALAACSEPLVDTLPASSLVDGEAATAQAVCLKENTGLFDVQCELTLDGNDRIFRLTLPQQFSQDVSWPVVFNFHGAYSNAQQQSEWTKFPDKARAAGFILVTPSGSGVVDDDGSGFGFWNGGSCCSQADDVGFVRYMIDVVLKNYSGDPQRIYATGISNGGFMAFRLACDLADAVAAIASVAAPDGTTACQPSAPVPILQIHGTADALVPYGGGEPDITRANPFVNFSVRSITETVERWTTLNDCGTATGAATSGDVTCTRHTDCADGAVVEHCRVDGGGHTWPGGTVPDSLGYTTMDLDATDHIWNFFSAFAKP